MSWTTLRRRSCQWTTLHRRSCRGQLLAVDHEVDSTFCSLLHVVPDELEAALGDGALLAAAADDQLAVQVDTHRLFTNTTTACSFWMGEEEGERVEIAEVNTKYSKNLTHGDTMNMLLPCI